MVKTTGILFLFMSCLFFQTRAQDTDSPEKKITQFSLSANAIYGFVFAHDVGVENTRGTIVNGVELKLNRIRLDEGAQQYIRKSFNSGFTLGYYHFSKKLLGNAVYGAYFIEPYFINNQNFRLGLLAKIGLSYNSNPYNETTNNENKSYSLYFNPYLSLGLNASLKAAKNFYIDFDAMFNHNSNGGVNYPNSGINFPTAYLGINYVFDGKKITDIQTPEKFRWRLDVMPFASYKAISLDWEHFNWVYGFSFQANRQVGLFNSFNTGIEWTADHGLNGRQQMGGSAHTLYTRIGILAGHEFLFRKFNFNQQIGYLAYSRIPDLYRVYHRWGLYYKFKKNWMAGFNLSAHDIIADYLDLRVIYSFYYGER